uniref:Uncharacterized protein n=1 Tax=Sphaerodactylus townsendi TaxID=933632 RepID=A0ACB8FQX5_9SAUR
MKILKLFFTVSQFIIILQLCNVCVLRIWPLCLCKTLIQKLPELAFRCRSPLCTGTAFAVNAKSRVFLHSPPSSTKKTTFQNFFFGVPISEGKSVQVKEGAHNYLLFVSHFSIFSVHSVFLDTLMS